MTSPGSRLTEQFRRAIGLTGAERERFLRTLAREDPGAAAELRSLLEVDQRVGPLDAPCGSVSDPDLRPAAGGSVTPSQLVKKLAEVSPPASRYRLEGEVAHGGMGVILRAWDETLGRPLAMKVVLGQENPEGEGPTPPVEERTLARFLEEAQVTGQLDHPGVVPVHELGLNRHGSVYFTMRLVKGLNLHEVYALVREGKEGWNETRALSVLLKVCETMAYAHTKGVIHRDLKPANVMVGKFGEVYVMDWGLAKVRGTEDRHDLRLRPPETTQVRSERSANARDAPGSPLVTMDGTVLGTPEYMPPEQAEGRTADLGPRADVYALGAMLYELLTGERPYVAAGARLSPYTIVAMILAGPPKAVASLNPRVPPELEVICNKAMARDASQRYADTSELAEDLRAFLEHRVVKAHRTGALVELRKWIERNKALAAAIGAAFLLLVIGLTTSLVLKARSDRNAKLARENALIATASESRALEGESAARRNEELARRNEAAAEEERKRADLEARRMERILGTFEQVLRSPDPGLEGAEVRMAEVLEQAAQDVRVSLSDDPVARVRLSTTLGKTLLELGVYDQAAALLEEVLASVASAEGVRGPNALGLKSALAHAYLSLDRFAEAERLMQEVYAAWADAPGSALEQLEALQALGNLYFDRGDRARARDTFDRVFERLPALLDPSDPQFVRVANSVATARLALDDTDGAIGLLEDTLQRAADLPEDDIDLLSALDTLGSALHQKGRLAEATQHHRRAYDGFARRLGPGHSDTLGVGLSLAIDLRDGGDFEAAEALYRQLIQHGEETLGQEHSVVLSLYNSFAQHLGQVSRSTRSGVLRKLSSGDVALNEEALAYHRKTYEGRKKRLGEDHPETLASMNNLGRHLHGMQRHAEALPLLEGALERRRATLGPDHRLTLSSMLNLASLLHSMGENARAEELFRASLEGRRVSLGEQDPYTLTGYHELGVFLKTLDRPKEAEPLLYKAADGRRALFGIGNPASKDSLAQYLDALRRLGRIDEALERIGISLAELPAGDPFAAELTTMEQALLDGR